MGVNGFEVSGGYFAQSRDRSTACFHFAYRSRRSAAPIFGLKVLSSAQFVVTSLVFFQKDELCKMPFNDQAGFAEAMHDLDFAPFVLPYNWNLRPRWHRSFWGPIKIWHDVLPVPAGLVRWNENQTNRQNPIQYTELR